jgi:hypothetical protein
MLDVVPGLALVVVVVLALYASRRTPNHSQPPDAPPADEAAQPLGPVLQEGLFTAAFVRRRLVELATEMERLDTEPEVFARAFHLYAARSAYEALQADAAHLPVPAAHGSGAPVIAATIGAPATWTSRAEEIVL